MKHTITRSNKRINRRKNGKKTRRIKRLLKSFNRRKVTYNRKHKRSHSHKRSHKHKHSHKHKRTYKNTLRRRQKGGDAILPGYEPANNGDAAHNKQVEADTNQNKINNQSGGGVDCCNSSDPYSYPCPDGMCGPIPQTASATSNGLILQAAKITASTNANAEFDTQVANPDTFNKP
jgi:hypothetical protein